MTAFTLMRNGVLFADEALRLAWALEDRGFTFRRDGDQLLLGGPIATLTEADRQALQLWKPSLLTMVDYETPAI